MSELAGQTANAELWRSENPRFGAVRHVVVAGDYAATFDDLNGDGREVCLTLRKRTSPGWHRMISVDDVGIPEVGEEGSSGWSNGHAYVVGRSSPHNQVLLAVEQESFTVQANSDGWWLFIRRCAAPQSDYQRAIPYITVHSGTEADK